MFLILVLVLLVTLFYYYVVKPVQTWKEKGVAQDDLLTAIWDNYFNLIRRTTLYEFVQSLYEKFPGKRYHGICQFNRPLLVLKDTELIKQMMIKDFEYFNEHRDFVPADVDPLFSKNLFSLKGTQWRHMRSTLSPSFTSSKMKLIFILMQEYSQKFIDFYISKKQDTIDVEMKDMTSKYCNDVIASTAFGTQVDSFNYPDNQFFKAGKTLTDLRSFSTQLRFFINFCFPSISRLFKIKFLNSETGDFLTNVIEDTIRIRDEKGIVRPDMIHLLMEARKGNLKHEEEVTDTGFATVEEHLKGSTDQNISNEDIVSQALIFFFAGFDSVSTLMCFMAYELCANQDIQNKLREEIKETLEQCNGKLTYEALVNMAYMDMVVTETLRKWPTQVGIERVCTKPYTIEPTLPEEKAVVIDVGMGVFLPTYGIHHDPNNFPDPDVFDPERFSEENKVNIIPYTFQPFGLGPRNCIGSRFALMETKILFFYLLKYFKIIPTQKTQIPIKLSKNIFSVLPPEGFFMGLQRIKE